MTGNFKDTCKIRLQNFEGPFDLLFHLIEKNEINIYDIPISDITNQYMDFLFAMKELDMEIASEFLVMAATLLHIKSKMLLPKIKDDREEEGDPREELVMKLVEYKKYKQISQYLSECEKKWSGCFYRIPEENSFQYEYEIMDLSAQKLSSVYNILMKAAKDKINPSVINIEQIIIREKVTIRSKILQIVSRLKKTGNFMFSELFSIKKVSKTDVITGFNAVLELARLSKVKLLQENHFDDITVNGIDISGDYDQLYDESDEYESIYAKAE